MRLSHGVLGAFTKYPISAETQRSVKASAPPGSEIYCGAKKFGIFDSEMEIFRAIAKLLDLPEESASTGVWWRRHPLVFLVEAADDICYNILDLEDAYTAGDLSFETVYDAISGISGRSNSHYDSQTPEERISEMRARAIGASIHSCVEAFKHNYDEIMQGSFSGSLVDVSSKKDVFGAIKEIAKQRIFTGRRKTQLEVEGRNVLFSVLNGVYPILESLRSSGWSLEELKGYEKQVVSAIQIDLRDAKDSYSALHCLTDYVSGMTDRYAVKIAEMLHGAN